MEITTVENRKVVKATWVLRGPATVPHAIRAFCLPELLFNMYIHKEQICNYL